LRSARVLDASSGEAVREAARVICSGGLVAFPTETVYGLGADACDPLAVARVFEVKRRPSIDPLIVHVAEAESALRYGRFETELSRKLMARFWPGPLTLVVPKTDAVPPIVTAGLDTVAIRVPAHPAALSLIREAGRAIAAPSANPFGYVSPTEARHVAEQLGDEIDLILDGGPCTVGVESTIVSVTGTVPRVLRLGGVPLESLIAAAGTLVEATGATSVPEAPGQLTRHYATRTPLQIADPEDQGVEPRAGERVGLIALLRPRAGAFESVEVLSQSGDLREAAANLFSALRRLDRLELDRIVAYRVPETGLGAAIMDRLRRCSAR
jgi:L-threonylcarbamoyladenylate synthase